MSPSAPLPLSYEKQFEIVTICSFSPKTSKKYKCHGVSGPKLLYEKSTMLRIEQLYLNIIQEITQKLHKKKPRQKHSDFQLLHAEKIS